MAVNGTAPSAVMRRVCSNCAVRLPSAVAAVHLSGHMMFWSARRRNPPGSGYDCKVFHQHGLKSYCHQTEQAIGGIRDAHAASGEKMQRSTRQEVEKQKKTSSWHVSLHLFSHRNTHERNYVVSVPKEQHDQASKLSTSHFIPLTGPLAYQRLYRERVSERHYSVVDVVLVVQDVRVGVKGFPNAMPTCVKRA